MIAPILLSRKFRQAALLCKFSHNARHKSSKNASNTLQLCFSPEVAEAKRIGKPIVALESTIISHGMPYPQNLAVARELEAIVREKGAVPATIAIMAGVPCIGLTDDQLLTLARDQKQVVKASTRDLAYVISTAQHGATTVASTMRLAHLAGIAVFATGGLGGVHRGAESTMDISTDLIELGRTPVTVVCAGIKSILDVRKSLEVLETQGVPVVGYQTQTFPAFFTNDSGLSVHAHVNSASEMAQLLLAQQTLCPTVGSVLAVPNPHPAHAASIQAAIQQALAEADAQHISGNAITPFLLERIEQLTKGQSLASNIALVKHNVSVACDLAVQLQQLQLQTKQITDTTIAHHEETVGAKEEEAVVLPEGTGNEVVVVGGATVDIISTVNSNNNKSKNSGTNDTSNGDNIDAGSSTNSYYAGSSNPGSVSQSFGGVARNLATHLATHGTPATLLTVWAQDTAGVSLGQHLRATPGVDTRFVNVLDVDDSSTNTGNSTNATNNSNTTTTTNTAMTTTDSNAATHAKTLRTAVYNAIHSASGDLLVGVADMDIFLHGITPRYLEKHRNVFQQAALILSDANLSAAAFVALTKLAHTLHKPLCFEPTSDHKCILPLQTQTLHRLSMLKPNASELLCMLRFALDQCRSQYPTLHWHNVELLVQEAALEAQLRQRQDVETLALLSATLLDLMHATPVTSSSTASSSTSSTEKNNSDNKSYSNGSCISLYCTNNNHHHNTNASNTTNGAASASTTVATGLIDGKHLLVSLGAQGLLWTASVGHFERLSQQLNNHNNSANTTTANSNNTANSNATGYGRKLQDGMTWRIQGFDSYELRAYVMTPHYLSLHLLATPLHTHNTNNTTTNNATNTTNNSVIHSNTNGAGDALFAGVIRSLLQNNHNDTNNTSNVPNSNHNSVSVRPNFEDVLQGMEAARQHLLRK